MRVLLSSRLDAPMISRRDHFTHITPGAHFEGVQVLDVAATWSGYEMKRSDSEGRARDKLILVNSETAAEGHLRDVARTSGVFFEGNHAW